MYYKKMVDPRAEQLEVDVHNRKLEFKFFLHGTNSHTWFVSYHPYHRDGYLLYVDYRKQ